MWELETDQLGRVWALFYDKSCLCKVTLCWLIEMMLHTVVGVFQIHVFMFIKRLSASCFPSSSPPEKSTSYQHQWKPARLTIIWISHLHTCRSCSLLTYILFRAQRTPWFVRTRNTIAKPPAELSKNSSPMFSNHLLHTRNDNDFKTSNVPLFLERVSTLLYKNWSERTSDKWWSLIVLCISHVVAAGFT